jgi:hypothetical protein
MTFVHQHRQAVNVAAMRSARYEFAEKQVLMSLGIVESCNQIRLTTDGAWSAYDPVSEPLDHPFLECFVECLAQLWLGQSASWSLDECSSPDSSVSFEEIERRASFDVRPRLEGDRP